MSGFGVGEKRVLTGVVDVWFDVVSTEEREESKPKSRELGKARDRLGTLLPVRRASSSYHQHSCVMMKAVGPGLKGRLGWVTET